MAHARNHITALRAACAGVWLAALALPGLEQPVYGDIVVNDAAINTIGPNTYFQLMDSTSAGGLFLILISDQGAGSFEFSYSGIAEEFALYNVSSGQLVNASFAQSTTPLVSNNGSDPGSAILSLAPGESRYLGYWDDRSPFDLIDNEFDNHPDAGDNYGWALLTWNGATLSVTESATAIGGGIIAGTLTQVPEPTTFSMIMALSGMLLARKRLRS